MRRRSSPQGEPAARRLANQQTAAPAPGQMDLELEAENAAIESVPPAKPEKPPAAVA